MGRPTRGIDSTDASKPVPAPHPTRPTRWSSRPRSTVRIESKVSLFSMTRRTSPSPADSQCRRGTTLRQRRKSKVRRPGPNRTVPTSRSSAFSSPNTSSDRSREGTMERSRLWCNHRFTCSIVSSWDRVRPVRGTQARFGCQTMRLAWKQGRCLAPNDKESGQRGILCAVIRACSGQFNHLGACQFCDQPRQDSPAVDIHTAGRVNLVKETPQLNELDALARPGSQGVCSDLSNWTDIRRLDYSDGSPGSRWWCGAC